MPRVVSRFLSRRFHPKSRRLFPFYFSNITLRTDLLTFGVTGAGFKIAGEMRRLPAYFDNPVCLPSPSLIHWKMFEMLAIILTLHALYNLRNKIFLLSLTKKLLCENVSVKIL